VKRGIKSEGLYKSDTPRRALGFFLKMNEQMNNVIIIELRVNQANNSPYLTQSIYPRFECRKD
jgi:hypothetical protein